METHTFPKTPLRIIRALALIAIVCSGYLLYQKLSGIFDDCCGHVLNSRWSHWFGIPVSALSVAMYALLAVVTLPAVAIPHSAFVGKVLRTCAFLAVGAALWFFVLLLFVEKTTCPYCIAAHVCGLVMAGVVFAAAGPRFPTSGALPPAIGVLGLAVLVAGQLLGDGGGNLQLSDSGGDNPPEGSTRGDGAIAFTRDIRIDPDAFPRVGAAQPEHYLAELFDYTCKSCRSMYADLKQLMAQYPDTFSVIYLPTPLNRRCNTFLPARVENHEHACELAKTALAVWQADPGQFETIHDYLMTTPLPIPPGDAEAKAISLVGEPAYREAHASAAVSGTLATCFGHYGVIARSNIRMPKLLLGGGKVLQGVAPNSATFVSLMAKQFELDQGAPAPTP